MRAPSTESHPPNPTSAQYRCDIDHVARAAHFCRASIIGVTDQSAGILLRLIRFSRIWKQVHHSVRSEHELQHMTASVSHSISLVIRDARTRAMYAPINPKNETEHKGVCLHMTTTLSLMESAVRLEGEIPKLHSCTTRHR